MRALFDNEASDILALLALIAFLSTAFVLLGVAAGSF
jgi:hypothetical protein